MDSSGPSDSSHQYNIRRHVISSHNRIDKEVQYDAYRHSDFVIDIEPDSAEKLCRFNVRSFQCPFNFSTWSLTNPPNVFVEFFDTNVSSTVSKALYRFPIDQNLSNPEDIAIFLQRRVGIQERVSLNVTKASTVTLTVSNPTNGVLHISGQGLAVGQTVVGSGIPVNTTITALSINASGVGTITLSKAATDSVSTRIDVYGNTSNNLITTWSLASNFNTFTFSPTISSQDSVANTTGVITSVDGTDKTNFLKLLCIGQTAVNNKFVGFVVHTAGSLKRGDSSLTVTSVPYVTTALHADSILGLDRPLYITAAVASGGTPVSFFPQFCMNMLYRPAIYLCSQRLSTCTRAFRPLVGPVPQAIAVIPISDKGSQIVQEYFENTTFQVTDMERVTDIDFSLRYEDGSRVFLGPNSFILEIEMEFVELKNSSSAQMSEAIQIPYMNPYSTQIQLGNKRARSFGTGSRY